MRRSISRASTRRAVLVLAAAMLFAALERGTLSAQAATEKAFADLVVNGEKRGSIEFELDQNGEMILRSELVRSILAGVAKDSIISALAGRDRVVSADELGQFGLSFAFDRSNLALNVNVPPNAMPMTTIGVEEAKTWRSSPKALRNAAFAATLGASAEFDPAYRWNQGETSSSYAAKLGLSPSIRTLGIVAEGSGDLGYDGQKYSLSLDSARVIRDFPQLGARLAAGIVGAQPVSFQAGQELYGLSFAREASLPGASRILASLSDALELSSAADVTVEVNQIVVKRQRLPQGSYRFSDIVLSSGLNQIRVIVAETGKEPRVYRFGVPYDESLLGPGAVDYSLVLGTARDEPTMPFGAAHAAVGIGRYFQLGADAETGYGRALGGISALAASPIGTIGLTGSLSASLSETAFLRNSAYAARAYWRFSSPGSRYTPSLGAAAEYKGQGFVAPSAAMQQTGAAWDLSGQVSEALPASIGSIAAFGDATVVGGSVQRWSGTIGLTIPIARVSLLSFSGGYDWSADAGLALRATASVTLSPSGRFNLSYRHDFEKKSDSADLSIGLEKDGKSTLALYGEGLFGGSDRVLGLSLTKRTPIATFSGSSQYYAGLGGDSETTGALSVSTTLAFADGAFAATSLPSDSLAILLPSRDLLGQDIELRPEGGAPSSSESGRPAVVPGLTPYQDYSASIELPRSSPETRPVPSFVAISPEYRSIAVIRVAVAPSITVRGVLVDENDKLKTNMLGDIIYAKGENLPSSGIFTDEKGVFECYGLSPGLVTIIWEDGSVLAFQVPQGKPGSVIDLGPLASHHTDSGGVKP